MALSTEAVVEVVGVVVGVVLAVPGIMALAWQWRKRQLKRQDSRGLDGKLFRTFLSSLFGAGNTRLIHPQTLAKSPRYDKPSRA